MRAPASAGAGKRMALFGYSMGERVSRGRGQSAVRTAAYLARDCYEDQRTGWVHDFRKSQIMEAADHIARAGRHAELGSRQEVLFLGLYAPEGAPDWCRGAENIERFWNAAEAAEKHGRAQVAERVIIALPHEFTLEHARWALQDHIREFTRQGRVVQLAIHSPQSPATMRATSMPICWLVSAASMRTGSSPVRHRSSRSGICTAASTWSISGKIGHTSSTATCGGMGSRGRSTIAAFCAGAWISRLRRIWVRATRSESEKASAPRSATTTAVSASATPSD